MERKVLIDSLCGQTRLAVIEDGRLCEYYEQTQDSASLSGNIYCGRVQNVLPGMNAAFVDIGIEKNAFLYAGDIQIDTHGEDELAKQLKNQTIDKIVRNGQNVLVQVIKEPGGSKGPRVSTNITIAGRLIVLLPTIKYVGISHKINGMDRNRLHKLGTKLITENGNGLIIRTAALSENEESIADEYRELCEKWSKIRQAGNTRSKPCLIYTSNSLVDRAIRDFLRDDTSAIVTDCGLIYDRLRSEYGQTTVCKLELYKGDIPLFDVYSVTSEIEKLFSRNVWLKSGGYIVIDNTEALTVIDVNTGKNTGKKTFDETIYKTNCEAAKEVARQIRLRDIGGIIIVDFIDMDSHKQKEELVNLLKKETENDNTHVTVSGITSLGLIEMTRKKARQSVYKIYQDECRICRGTGLVLKPEVYAWRAIREINRRNLQQSGQKLLITAHPAVVSHIEEIGVPFGCEVYVSEKEYQYDSIITVYDFSQDKNVRRVNVYDGGKEQ